MGKGTEGAGTVGQQRRIKLQDNLRLCEEGMEEGSRNGEHRGSGESGRGHEIMDQKIWRKAC